MYFKTRGTPSHMCVCLLLWQKFDNFATTAAKDMRNRKAFYAIQHAQYCEKKPLLNTVYDNTKYKRYEHKRMETDRRFRL